MTMPDTTPMPNDTAKIRIQKAEMRRYVSRRVFRYSAFEHRDVRREPDRERGQQEMKRDEERELDAREEDRIHGSACSATIQSTLA